jgi:hypothetical protein
MARRGGLWSPPGPPHLLFSPLRPLPLEKNHHCSISRVLALEPEIFDLFARSSVFETVLGDCYLVCDSSIGPISFSSSGLYFEYLAILGAAVDELAC